MYKRYFAALLGRHRRVAFQIFQRPYYKRERRAEFVGYIGEETHTLGSQLLLSACVASFKGKVVLKLYTFLIDINQEQHKCCRHQEIAQFCPPRGPERCSDLDCKHSRLAVRLAVASNGLDRKFICARRKIAENHTVAVRARIPVVAKTLDAIKIVDSGCRRRIKHIESHPNGVFPIRQLDQRCRRKQLRHSVGAAFEYRNVRYLRPRHKHSRVHTFGIKTHYSVVRTEIYGAVQPCRDASGRKIAESHLVVVFIVAHRSIGIQHRYASHGTHPYVALAVGRKRLDKTVGKTFLATDNGIGHQIRRKAGKAFSRCSPYLSVFVGQEIVHGVRLQAVPRCKTLQHLHF